MTVSQPRNSPVALLSITLDRSAREPLTQQLYVQVRSLILSGRIAAGTRMPSTRRLCDDLNVSRTVTLAAYEQLSLEGYLRGTVGSGHVAAPLDHLLSIQDAPSPKPPAMPDAASHLAHAPFSPTCPPSDLFPHQSWARLLARGWRKHGPRSDEPNWAGLPALREAIASHIFSIKGIQYDPDQILITAGNADAVRIITRTIAAMRPDTRLSVWTEDPGYLAGRREILREGFDLVPVPVDADGLEVSTGIALAPDAALALLTPARQFPLGMPLSLPRRLQLLNWAQESGAILVEDDYDSEIRFYGRPVPSLAALDRAGSVLSLGSLSKLTFDGLRLGYIAGPQALIHAIARTRAAEQTLVPTSAQPAMAEFLHSGLFAAHLRQLRVQLKRRRTALIEALDRYLPAQFDFLLQEVGMHLPITFRRPPATSDHHIAVAAKTAGLRIEPLSGFFTAAPVRQGFVLGYAGWPEPILDDATRRFSEILRLSLG